MSIDALPAPETGKPNYAFKVGLTHSIFEVPLAWRGRKVDISVRAPALNAAGQAASVWILFGTSAAIEVDQTAFVTGTQPAWTTNAKTGRPIRDGESKDYFVKTTATHFTVEADLANVEVYVFPSDFHGVKGR